MFGPNLIVNNTRDLVSGVSYDAESTALFERMTSTPDETRKAVIDAFIVGIKSDLGIANLSDAFDALYFTAAHDQQAARLNWVEDDHNLTEVNSPAWLADQGYTGNGTTQYLDTDYTLSVDSVNFIQDDNSFGVYIRTNVGEVGRDMGVANSLATFFSQILSRNAVDNLVGTINATSSLAYATTDSQGLSVAERTGANDVAIYRNGASVATSGANTSVALIPYKFFLLSRSLENVPDNYSTKQIGFSYIGNSSINQANLYTRVQAYFTGLEAGFDSESVALFARMDTEPDIARKTVINDFIVGIKSDLSISNLSDAFDAIWFPAAATQQAARLNWVEDDHNLTEVNSPTWTADQGYTGNGTTQYLTTDYILSTDSVNYTQNDSSFGVYIRTNTSSNNREIGVATAVPAFFSQIVTRNASDEFVSFHNSDADSIRDTETDSRGLSTSVRTTATDVELFKNGVSFATDAANASTAIPAYEFYLLARNLAGVADNFSAKEIGFAFVGDSTINQANLYTRVQQLFTDLGTQV